jgi:tagatose 6-phosphate kinase
MNTHITTVTLNAAIDKTYYLPSLDKGKVNRADKVLSMAGGKGNNVARVLRQLGHVGITATGFASGYNGKFIIEQLNESGIITEFVAASGESRLCLNFLDGSSTEVLEPGPEIFPEHLDNLKRELHRLSASSRLVIFSGSIPKGLSTDLYAELIELSRSAGAEVFLDASGDPLIQGLKAMPIFIKPNEDEIESLLPFTGKTDIRNTIVALMEQGVPNVVVTLGGEGAIAGVNGKLFQVKIPQIQTVNTVGCGDAFVAGYAFGYVRNWPPEQCLRHAAAAGCANALSPVAGDLKLSDQQDLLREVQVEQWLS